MLFNIVYRYTSMEGGTDGARATVLRRRRLRRRLLLTARRTTAADCSGRPLDVHPDLGLLFYNTACCESLAGQPDQAVAHLARAIELWNGCAVWRRARSKRPLRVERLRGGGQPVGKLDSATKRRQGRPATAERQRNARSDTL